MLNNEDLIRQLIKLEEETSIMEPQGAELNNLTKEIVNYAHSYLNKIGEQPAYDGSPATGEQLFSHPFNEQGRDLPDLLSILNSDVDTPGINPASGSHLGYIPGGGIYPSAMGDYLAAVVNKYSGIFYASPGAVQLENMVIRWMAKILGFPNTAMGNLTSGGSIANLIAIVTARDAKGISSEKIKNSCIYLTKQAHHSVHKAIRIAGLGEAHLREIDVDEKYKLKY